MAKPPPAFYNCRMEKTNGCIPHDYLPVDAAQFRSFMLNLLKVTEDKFQEWGIPSDELEKLEGLYADFVQAFNAACAAPTSSTIRTWQKAKEKVTAALEQFIDRFLQSPPLTGHDRAQMGII